MPRREYVSELRIQDTSDSPSPAAAGAGCCMMTKMLFMSRMMTDGILSTITDVPPVEATTPPTALNSLMAVGRSRTRSWMRLEPGS